MRFLRTKFSFSPALLVLALFTLVACVSPVKSERVFLLADGVNAELPQFVAPAETLVLRHEICANYDGREENFTGIVKWTDSELTVVALSPLGRIFTATCTAAGDVFGEASDMLPHREKLAAQYPLWEMMLVIFPIEKIRDALPAGTEIVELENATCGRVRELSQGGKIVVRIEFSGADFTSGKIVFRNLLRGYAYEMLRPDDE